MMSTTEPDGSTWRPPMIIMLVALVALVLGAAMIVFVALNFKSYWTSTAKIIALVGLALVWLTGLLAAGALVRVSTRR